MEYQIFKEELVHRLSRRLDGGSRIFVQEIEKNNGIRQESMTILTEEDRAAPAVFLRPLYEAFQSGISIEKIAQQFCEMLCECPTEEIGDGSFFSEYEQAVSHICYRLINYEKNIELLKKLPHRRVLDLALVYYYHFEDFSGGMASILVRSEHMQDWKVSEEDLYREAGKNTMRILPARLAGLMQMISEIAEGEKQCSEMPENFEYMMYVLTNDEKYFGAVCFLYPGLAKRIGEVFQKNFYLLPSSIHECILVPDSGQMLPQELREIVRDVNRQCVQADEILSDQIYYYDRARGVFMMEH